KHVQKSLIQNIQGALLIAAISEYMKIWEFLTEFIHEEGGLWCLAGVGGF
ncbi:hypothetical protein ACJX0J_007845, partial [Zea mays]